MITATFKRRVLDYLGSGYSIRDDFLFFRGDTVGFVYNDYQGKGQSVHSGNKQLLERLEKEFPDSSLILLANSNQQDVDINQSPKQVENKEVNCQSFCSTMLITAAFSLALTQIVINFDKVEKFGRAIYNCLKELQ